MREPMKVHEADVFGVGVAWFVWLASHLEQINDVLQTIALLLSIGASLAVLYRHIKEWYDKRKRNP